MGQRPTPTHGPPASPPRSGSPNSPAVETSDERFSPHTSCSGPDYETSPVPGRSATEAATHSETSGTVGSISCSTVHCRAVASEYPLNSVWVHDFTLSETGSAPLPSRPSLPKTVQTISVGYGITPHLSFLRHQSLGSTKILEEPKY